MKVCATESSYQGLFKQRIVWTESYSIQTVKLLIRLVWYKFQQVSKDQGLFRSKTRNTESYSQYDQSVSSSVTDGLGLELG